MLRRPGLTSTLYVGLSFLAAGMVFMVQPMAARLLLPRFGGSAAVWNTALVVFQVLLLGGYGLAHLFTLLGGRWRLIVQMAVIAVPMAVLPFALPDPVGDLPPAPAVALTLAAMIGLPYLVLTTMSPTIQRWFADTGHRLAKNPYPLYAASNAGSILALLAYPLLVEPLWSVADQARGFAWGYRVMVVLALVAVGALYRRAGTGGHRPAELVTVAPTGESQVLGDAQVLFLAFVPSLLLLAVTQHISTDVAAFPLLWVIPLVVYLASFVVAFGGGAGITGAWRALRLVVGPALLLAFEAVSALWVAVALPLVVLALAAFVAHRRLFEGRPPAAQLTRFYVLLSTGGALGGVAGALVAPLVFDRVLEYPVALVLAAAVIPATGGWRPVIPRAALPVVAVAAAVATPFLGESVALVVLGAALVVVFAAAWDRTVFVAGLTVVAVGMLWLGGDSTRLTAVRTFYGNYRVVDTGDTHRLVSGTTVHGVQAWNDGRSDPLPAGYYHPDGPAGRLLSAALDDGASDVGVIGLGAGALASYGRPGDRMTFYELDPAVAALAEDDRYFTYLSGSPASVDVMIGDGRLELERTLPRHDVLVVDAFSSDSIPVHLLTAESLETYRRTVGGGGVILFHISNRHLDLEPVLGRLAAEAGMTARVAHYSPPEGLVLAGSSVWFVMGDDPDVVASYTSEAMWVAPASDGPLWTDDFSDVVSVIRWGA